MTDNWLLERVTFVIPLILSLSVHEWAHAYSAHLLGDDTAARMGRLTLNPIPHIDPIGTLLLPLMGVPFGWAKPVPVNPARFSRKVSMNTGMMITAPAGPASNLVLAILCIIAKIVLIRTGVRDEAVWWLVSTGFWLNVILAFFNMLPIPPLDGSRVVDGLMPYRLRPAWERIARYGPLALLAVIVLPRMFSFSLFSGPLRMANDLANAVIRAALGV